jgi:nucleoside-diphosphate-sugar epimerase
MSNVIVTGSAEFISSNLAEENVNITGALNVFLAARNKCVKKVVYASSASVYGDRPILLKVEDMTPNPLSPYAVTKLTGEYYCKVFHDVYGLDIVYSLADISRARSFGYHPKYSLEQG